MEEPTQIGAVVVAKIMHGERCGERLVFVNACLDKFTDWRWRGVDVASPYYKWGSLADQRPATSEECETGEVDPTNDPIEWPTGVIMSDDGETINVRGVVYAKKGKTRRGTYLTDYASAPIDTIVEEGDGWTLIRTHLGWFSSEDRAYYPDSTLSFSRKIIRWGDGE